MANWFPDCIGGFNTQPPEGGWHKHFRRQPPLTSFNTQPPEGGWSRSGQGG